MTRKVGKRDSQYLARLVTENRAPCAFCHREIDDEVTYGKLYAIGDIQCHYFCALLSCCLVQNGPEQEGLFGFMYKDILAELERSKKHKCSFCSKGGANLGCSISSCRKQFHLPCGRERNAVSLYYGTFKSFCHLHAPKQNIPEHIMCKAKQRMKGVKVPSTQDGESTEEMVCVICYEAVDAFPTVNTFWPPCCGKDAWFHRSCLQRMALSAGMHYLKCPLCNDKQNFYDAVLDQGYYVPDRDAAWELEQNAFAEIYERPLDCTVEECKCPMGRNHDAEQGEWDIKLCLLCGSVGAHAHCIGASEAARYVCLTCKPAAPEDLQTLADTIEKLILQEQAATVVMQRGPVMPSRMSLRRTKGRAAIATRPSSSRSHDVKTECESTNSPETIASRKELNLSTPRKFPQSTNPDLYNTSPYKNKPLEESNKNEISYKRLKSPIKMSQSPIVPYKCMEGINSPVKINRSNDVSYKINGNLYGHEMDAMLMSPMKLLERSLNEKGCMGVKDLDEKLVVDLRKKFKKPGPLSEKRKIIENILDGLITNLNTSEKHKKQIREWCSPRKSCDITDEIPQIEDATKFTEDIRKNKENCKEETPRKSTISIRKKSTQDEENHSFDNNIDLDAMMIHSEEATDLTEITDKNKENCKQEAPRKSSRNIRKKSTKDEGSHSSDNNIDLDAMMIQSEDARKLTEDTGENKENCIQETPRKSTRSFRKESSQIRENFGNNIDLDATETKIDNNDGKLDSKDISKDKDYHERVESVKNVEPKEITVLDSLEINCPSKDLAVKCDVSKEVKSDDFSEAKCAFKFSPLDKEKLEKKNVDISLESFKKSYLSEVGKEKSSFDKRGEPDFNLNSAIDLAVDVNLKEKVVMPKKRKLSEIVLVFNKNDAKKRKISEIDSNLSSSDDFEDKKEVKTPVPRNKNEKFKVKILSKRNEQKHVKDMRKEKKRLRSKRRDTIPDEAKVLKEKSVKEMETEKCENKSNQEGASNISKNIIIEKENGPPKRKFHESSQWMAEITELDKKLEMEAKRKARKNERNLKTKKFPTLGMKECSQDNKTDNEKLRTDKNCVNVKKTKEIINKANEESEDGVIKKEKIRKLKKEKQSRQQKRSHKLDRKYKKDKNHKEKYEESKQNDQNIELTIDSSETKLKKKKNKMKTKLSIRNNEKDISVKIKWKKKQLRLEIKGSKKEKIHKIDNDHSKYKQYVLQYFSEISPKQVLAKPEKEVNPLKRKYVKQEKSPDKFKQLSIERFFKTTSPT